MMIANSRLCATLTDKYETVRVLSLQLLQPYRRTCWGRSHGVL